MLLDLTWVSIKYKLAINIYGRSVAKIFFGRRFVCSSGSWCKSLGVDPRRIEVFKWNQKKFVGSKLKISVLKYQIRTFRLLSIYFEKEIKAVLSDLLAVCVSVYHPINFWELNQFLWYLLYAPEPISTKYFMHLSPLCVCTSTCILLSLLGNGSIKALPRQRMHM